MEDENRVQEIVQQLNIIDDVLFQKMAEDIGFCEEMISTILQQKVTVQKVTPQNSIKNLQGRSVVLDALCTFEDGKECNVEVQKADDDNHVKRVRYNTSCITANITEPGSKFEKVPDVIGIFISKFDVFDAGKTVYHIDRVIRETGEVQDNGLQEVYVNTKVDDKTDTAELMRIFTEGDRYDFEKFPKVSARKKKFKQSEGGKGDMCDLVEEYAREKAIKAAKEAAKEATRKAAKEAEEKAVKVARKSAEKLLQNGVAYDLVRATIDTLSDEELREIYDSVRKQG